MSLMCIRMGILHRTVIYDTNTLMVKGIKNKSSSRSSFIDDLHCKYERIRCISGRNSLIEGSEDLVSDYWFTACT